MKLLLVSSALAFSWLVLSPVHTEGPEKRKESKDSKEVVDEYSVIKVQGNILYSRSNSAMKTGDRFKSNEKLVFKTDNSRAAVISKSKGRLVLQKDDKSSHKLIPAMNNISSRSGAIVNVLDLKKYFSDQVLVLDTLKVQVNEELFPQNEKSFFHISYDWNGETIHKQLPYEDDKMLIWQEGIFTVDGEPIDGSGVEQMSLWYRSADDGKSSKVSDFTLVFPDSESLKGELQVLMGSLDADVESKKMDEVQAYLTQFYAKPQEENVNDWMERNLELID